jgi:hypothetical protein
MKLTKFKVPVVAALILVTTFVTFSVAEEPTDSRDETERPASDAPADILSAPWQFNANIYLWLPKAPMTITVDGHEVANIPESLDNILDSLEMGAMFELEAHKGPISVFADTIYYDGDYSEHFRGALGQRRKFELEEKAWVITYGLAYSFGPWELGEGADSPTVTVSPYVGGLYLTDDIMVKVDPGISDMGLDRDTTLSFNTPLVGLVTYWDLSERWFLKIEGNWGGWDVDDVDETYDIIGLVAYRFKMWDVSSKVFGGYRYLHLDYKKKGMDLELAIKGPFFGIGWEF